MEKDVAYAQYTLRKLIEELGYSVVQGLLDNAAFEVARRNRNKYDLSTINLPTKELYLTTPDLSGIIHRPDQEGLQMI